MLSTLGNYLLGGEEDGKKVQGFFPWLASPIGEGKNAQSPLQMILGGATLYQQAQQHEDQLEQARQAYEWTKSNTIANGLTQAANYGNQALFQLQNFDAFHKNSNPGAATQYATTLGATFDTMNQAFKQLGYDNAMDNQIKRLNEIANYNINGVNVLNNGA